MEAEEILKKPSILGTSERFPIYLEKQLILKGILIFIFDWKGLILQQKNVI